MIFLPMLLDVHSSIFKDCLAKVSFLARVTQLESPTPSKKGEKGCSLPNSCKGGLRFFP